MLRAFRNWLNQPVTPEIALALCMAIPITGCVGVAIAGLAAEKHSLERWAPTSDYTVEEGGWLLARTNFTGCAPWALDRIDRDSGKGPGNRDESQWHADPDELPERHARLRDYEGARTRANKVIARGHMSPARYHHHSQKEMDSCHNLRNALVQPQLFNAGSWAQVEARGAELAEDCDLVLSITFPIWKPQLDTTFESGQIIKRVLVDAYGRDELWEPGYLAKSYACFKGGKIVKFESYLASNSDLVAKEPISTFLTSIDELEFMSRLQLWGTDYEELERKK